MRKGPHPLPVHLGMIASNMQGNFGLPDGGADRARLTEECAVEVVRGIKAYQHHSFKRTALPTECVWQNGETKLIRPVVESARVGNTPLLIIPSLINRSYILDISEKKSFLRWCHDQGIDAYLLDWGALTLEDSVNIETVIRHKLGGALKFLTEKSGGRVDMMGYCMGGTLMLGAHHFFADHIRRMVFLATPYDFKSDHFELARLVRISSGYTLAQGLDRGHLGGEYLQALFASLDPDGAAKKFIRFSQMDQQSDEAKMFVAVEDWLNESVSLPKDVAYHCIQDWFMENKPMSGDWNIGPYCIDNISVSTPCLVISSDKDKLVPRESSAALRTVIDHNSYKELICSCGHIGLIIGRHAIKDVWQPIAEFILKK